MPLEAINEDNGPLLWTIFVPLVLCLACLKLHWDLSTSKSSTVPLIRITDKHTLIGSLDLDRFSAAKALSSRDSFSSDLMVKFPVATPAATINTTIHTILAPRARLSARIVLHSDTILLWPCRAYAPAVSTLSAGRNTGSNTGRNTCNICPSHVSFGKTDGI